MAIKLCKVVSFYKGLPCIRSLNPLNSRSYEITLQIKYIRIFTKRGSRGSLH